MKSRANCISVITFLFCSVLFYNMQGEMCKALIIQYLGCLLQIQYDLLITKTSMSVPIDFLLRNYFHIILECDPTLIEIVT